MNSLLSVLIERFLNTANSPILFIYGTQVFKLERTNESKFVLLFLLDGSSVSLLLLFSSSNINGFGIFNFGQGRFVGSCYFVIFDNFVESIGWLRFKCHMILYLPD